MERLPSVTLTDASAHDLALYVAILLRPVPCLSMQMPSALLTVTWTLVLPPPTVILRMFQC